MSTLDDADRAPVVSVILPTHDRLEFLQECVASVLAQTLRDWELIIAHDGSGNDVRAFLHSIEDPPRIKVLWLTHTGRPSAVRNAAIRMASGKFVAFIDSDDLWAPEKLALQVRTLYGNTCSRWSYTAFVRVDARGRALAAEQHRPWTPHQGDVFEHLVSTQASVRTPSVMADRTLVLQAGGFDETLTAGEDYDLWMRLALLSPVIAIDAPLVHVRLHSANHSDSNWPRAFVGRDHSLRKLQSMARDRPRNQALLEKARSLNVLGLMREHVRRGQRRAATKALLLGARHSWRDLRWWCAAIKILLTVTSPSPCCRHNRTVQAGHCRESSE